jgi:hypothetical protein
VLKALGVALEPKPEAQRPRKGRVVRLFTRDIDRVAGAVVKVTVYCALAWAITFFVPLLHLRLGLAALEPEAQRLLQQ